MHTLEVTEPKVAEQYPAPEKTIWQHSDIDIDMPSSAPEAGMYEIKGAYVLHYDGGCSKKKGTGGYIAHDGHGKCLGGEFKYYGDNRPTNN